MELRNGDEKLVSRGCAAYDHVLTDFSGTSREIQQMGQGRFLIGGWMVLNGSGVL
jgi:hypothetical protein